MTGVGAALIGAARQANAAIKMVRCDTEGAMMCMLEMREMRERLKALLVNQIESTRLRSRERKKN
jgi:hypothetical protein